MKCPLIFAVNHSWGAHGDEAGNDCLKEECAFWNPRQVQCDPTGMMDEIVNIDKSLEDFNSKISVGGRR